MRLLSLFLLFLLIIGVVDATIALTIIGNGTVTVIATSPLYFDTIVTIVMENKNIGSITFSAAPYMTSLAGANSLATHYTAIMHPSEPNYIILFSGSNYGVTTDGVCCYTINQLNLVDRLETAGLTWRAFAEGASNSGTCSFTPPRNADHFPFKEFADMNTATRCANFRSSTASSTGCISNCDPELITELNSTTVANYVWLTPNDCDNMHSCSVTVGDNFLKDLVPRILTSKTFQTKRAVLFITFDEGSSTYPSDYVWTTFSGPVAKKTYSSGVQYSHYSYLSTLESNWGLASLTANDAGATVMGEFFK